MNEHIVTSGPAPPARFDWLPGTSVTWKRGRERRGTQRKPTVTHDPSRCDRVKGPSPWIPEWFWTGMPLLSTFRVFTAFFLSRLSNFETRRRASRDRTQARPSRPVTGRWRPEEPDSGPTVVYRFLLVHREVSERAAVPVLADGPSAGRGRSACPGPKRQAAFG